MQKYKGKFLNRNNVNNVIRQSGLLIFFAVLVIIFALIKPEFLTETNVKNVLQSAAIVGILACGQTLVILTAGFDLSIAKNAVVVGLAAAMLSKSVGVLAIPLALLLGIGLGLINGTLVAKAKVNPFVTTLGTFTILGSVALLINNGRPESNLPEWFRSLTSWNIAGFSSVIFWFLGIALVTHIVTSRTRFGRHIYATGGNIEASRLSGVRTSRIVMAAYSIAGFCAAVAGIVLTARLGTASPAALPSVELDSIAAVIIGGTRLSGGFGSIPRTIMGVLILSSLTSALVILQVDTYWQGVLKGAIIIIAVLVDVTFANKKFKS